MLLTDDPERTVIEPLAREKAGMEQVYDFDLMERGGHLAGWKLGREQLSAVAGALQALADPPPSTPATGPRTSLSSCSLWET